MDTHVFDYHGVKVHVTVYEGLVCINSKDMLKCLGFNDTDRLNNPEEMVKKLVLMKGTRKGLAFVDWAQRVVFPAMQRNL